MKAARRPALTVLVVAVLLTGLPLLPIPILTCPVCAGVARRALEPGFPKAQARTGCPCCRDRGRATALQAFKHRNVPRFLREAIQEPLRSAESRLRRGMLSSPGEDEAIAAGRGGFVVADGTDLAVVIWNQGVFSIPGNCHTRAWLFDLDGTLLDRVEGVCSTRNGSLVTTFAEDSPPDGALVKIEGWDGFGKREFFGDFDLSHGGRTTTILPRGNWMADGLCRLAIRNRRFHVLPLGDGTKGAAEKKP